MRAGDTSAPRRWAIRRLTVLGLVGTLLTVAIASSTAAATEPRAGVADPPPYLAHAADPAVTTLAEELGISIREAQQRMGWQEPAIEMAGELDRALGDRYGDLWFDPHTGRVKVGIVGGDTAGLAARLIAWRKLTAVTDLVPVRHSYAELKQAAAWLTAETARANPRARNGLVKGLSVWRLPDKNAVELDLPRGQRLTTAQQATVTKARQRLGGRLILGTWAGQMRDLACAWSFNEASRKTVFNCDPPLRGGLMMYIRPVVSPEIQRELCPELFSESSRPGADADIFAWRQLAWDNAPAAPGRPHPQGPGEGGQADPPARQGQGPRDPTVVQLARWWAGCGASARARG